MCVVGTTNTKNENGKKSVYQVQLEKITISNYLSKYCFWNCFILSL